MHLENSRAVLTGASGGLGSAIARALVRARCRVALTDVNQTALEKLAAELVNGDGNVLAVKTDITQAESVDELRQRVESDWGGADILVNCAGTFSVIAPVWEADPQKWLKDVCTNLYGTFLMCRAFTGGMVERRSGSVINIVSSGGVGDPHPYSTSYATSKTAVMRLTEGLAAETKLHGVTVFAVGPPAVRTAMTEFIMTDAGGKKWRPNFGSLMTPEKLSSPEVVSDLVMNLLSGRADALTGRFFDPLISFEDVLQARQRTLDEDLWTLRLRRDATLRRIH